MAATFTREQVAAIAALARIEVDPDELDLFAQQLGAILDYANEVQGIDTAGVPPTTSVLSRHESDRPDEIRPGLDRDAALANAPDAAPDDGAFRVPRVIG